MAASKALLLLLLVSLLQVSLQNVDDDFYKNPVRSADQDEIKNLPGLNEPINYRQFSGYLNADDPKTEGKKFFHYWFFESQSKADSDPLVLWLNGGPGCSSLAGLFTELGPFSVGADGKTLKLNDYSWNKQANLLFLESPADVGFSYSLFSFNTHTDDSTARENYQSLKSFMRKFPQFRNRSLYLTGESYAGVYLPTLGVMVDADPEFNLKGVAIGNGYLDATKLTDSMVLFTYHHGLIGKQSWDQLSEFCCGGKVPTRENCAFSGKDMSFSCFPIMWEIQVDLTFAGLNPYNIYGKCLQPKKVEGKSRFEHSKREMVDLAMSRLGLPTEVDVESESRKLFHRLDLESLEAVGDDAPCSDDHLLVNYLNEPKVRQAMHIPEKVHKWDVCSMTVSHRYTIKYPKLPGGLTPQMNQLINSKRNLTMLVYNGDVDTVCNFLGDEWFVDDLGRKVISDYSPWKVNKQVAGFVKHYEGITFATIRGSGHMVPGDRPVEALTMLSIFLNSTGHNTYL